MKHRKILKNTKIQIVPAGGVITHTGLPMALGKNRVAELKAINHNLTITADNTDDINLWFWRKSAPATFPLVASRWMDSEDIFYHHRFQHEFDTAVGHSKQTEDEWVPFPEGQILVRPPQLVSLSAGGVATVAVTIYFYEFEVSDDELTALMIQDHE